MKTKLLNLLALCMFITVISSSCKKDHFIDAYVGENTDAASAKKPNCFSACPQPVGTATVVLSPVIAPINNLPRVRVSIYYYYQSSKKGAFTVIIKNLSQSITLGQFTVNSVPSSPLDGSLGMVEKDFIFPVAFNSYSGYAIIVNGKSDCNPVCSSFTGNFIP